MTTAHVYEVRPRKDRCGFDLISNTLPFERLWRHAPAPRSQSSPSFIELVVEAAGLSARTAHGAQFRIQLGRTLRFRGIIEYLCLHAFFRCNPFRQWNYFNRLLTTYPTPWPANLTPISTLFRFQLWKPGWLNAAKHRKR
jgi:hypothetical protein